MNGLAVMDDFVEDKHITLSQGVMFPPEDRPRGRIQISVGDGCGRGRMDDVQHRPLTETRSKHYLVTENFRML